MIGGDEPVSVQPPPPSADHAASDSYGLVAPDMMDVVEHAKTATRDDIKANVLWSFDLAHREWHRHGVPSVRSEHHESGLQTDTSHTYRLATAKLRWINTRWQVSPCSAYTLIVSPIDGDASVDRRPWSSTLHTGQVSWQILGSWVPSCGALVEAFEISPSVWRMG